MKKTMAALLVVVGMALGSGLTMVLNPVGAASALVGATPSSSSHQSILQQALSTLVGNGTINQKQADAVQQQVQHLHEQQPRRGFGRMGMNGLGVLGRDGLSQLATALKTTPQQLMGDLRSGQSIAQIAQANGVDVSSLIATLENDAKTEIQKQVTAGHLTQAQADKIESGLATVITNLVNGKGFGFGFRFGRPGTAGPAAPTTTVPSTTPTTAGGSPTSTVAPSTSSTSTTRPTTSTTRGSSNPPNSTSTTQH